MASLIPNFSLIQTHPIITKPIFQERYHEFTKAKFLKINIHNNQDSVKAKSAFKNKLMVQKYFSGR